MAKIVKGLVNLEIDEYQGRPDPACESSGYVKKGDSWDICQACKGLGLLDAKVKSTVTFKIKPFSYEQKLSIVKFQTMVAGKLVEDSYRRAAEAVRAAVKEVAGLFQDDEEKVPYVLTFKGGTPEGDLTDDCLSDLMNTKLCPGLIAGCNMFLQGVPDSITDTSGRTIPGVRIVPNSIQAPIPN